MSFVIRCRRLLVVGQRPIRRRRDQRNQADIRAAADTLNHHVDHANSGLDTALLQRAVAHIVKAGPEEITKAEQRTRGVAGTDQRAVAGEGGDWRIDAFDQALQPFDQRHRAADRIDGHDQDAGAAIGEFKPRTAAADKHAKRRAEAAQPLQPYGAR